MLHIILKDLKSMMRRPVVFLLLLFGLIIGSASMIVYFTYGSEKLNNMDNMLIHGNSVEVQANLGDSMEQQLMYELLTDGTLPEMIYASSISYDSEGYDVVGLLDFENYFTTSGGGEFFTLDEENQNVAVISSDLFEGEEVQIGDRRVIAGAQMEIIGFMSKGYYIGEYFDLRQLPEGSEFVAGLDFSLERDDTVKNRPGKGAIVPFTTMMNNASGFYANNYHLTFKEKLTNEQRANIEQIITDRTGLSNFLPITLFSETYSTVQWSESAIYFVAVLAGIINIIALFAFFIRENRKQYLIYKLLGASNKKITAILISELSIYTLISYVIACAGAIPLMQNIAFFKDCKMPSLLSLIIIFLIIVIAASAICYGQIRYILKGKIKKDKKKRKKEFKNCSEELSVGNRTLYLMSFHYNRKNALNVCSIVCLALAVSFSFTYAMTYIFESQKFVRFYNENYKYETFVASPKQEVIDSTNGMLLGTMEDYTDSELYREYLEAITSLEGLQDYGIEYGNSIFAWYPGEYQGRAIYARSYSEGYLKNISMNLKSGSWEALLDYDKTDEDAVIPCIIFPYCEKDFPLGSTFTSKFDFDTGREHISSSIGEENLHGKITTETIERTFQVVGVLSEDGYMANRGYWSIGMYAPITNFLSPVSDAALLNYDAMMITPEVLHNGKLPYDYLPLHYLFAEKGNEEILDKWQIEASQYAEIDSFSNFLKNYREQFNNGGGDTYIMHSIIAALLLLLGVGGFSIIQFSMNKKMYGIYYICGMTWSKAIKLTLVTNAIDTILPSVVGAVISIIIAQNIRGNFASTSILLSMLCGIGAVIAIYLITSVILAIALKNKKPKNLLTEEAK